MPETDGRKKTSRAAESGNRPKSKNPPRTKTVDRLTQEEEKLRFFVEAMEMRYEMRRIELRCWNLTID